MIRNTKNIFIVSSGRTGTEFFGKKFNKLSKLIYSIHEPDRVSFVGYKRQELKTKIKRQGFFRLFILKAIGLSGARNLSFKKIHGKDIRAKFFKDRKWILFIREKIYIESNSQLFGMIQDLISLENSKVIIIYRDPRDWVTSWMNKGGWYDNKDLLSKINFAGFKRITPKNVGINNPDWKNYTRFQKLCWVWNYMNSNFYDAINENNQKIRHFFFEDIFIIKDETTIRNFLQFALEDYFKEEYVDKMVGMLQKKVNMNIKQDFPKWRSWDKKHCQDIHYFCGDLMGKLGYGNEPEWLKK